MGLFVFKVDGRSIEGLRRKFQNRYLKNIELARDTIRRDWGYEIHRQQLRFHRSNRWAPLSPIYLAKKSADYYDRSTDVRYITTLKRTGTMLKGYVSGISYDNPKGQPTVTMPYPAGNSTATGAPYTKIAGWHQDGTKNMPARPFDIEGFHQIAIDRFAEAIQKSFDG